MEDSIAVSVVVASHGRHLRLRWLLNALEEQTLDRARWEVIVVHTYDDETAARVLDSHPLTRAGLLSHIASSPAPAARRGSATSAGARRAAS